MPSGTLFLIVGASGVGKDTLIDGARQALAADSRFCFPQRVITRPADSGGEDHEPATEAEFEKRAARGDFFVTWAAHGLHYGLPALIEDELRRGRCVVVNCSRNAIPDIVARVPDAVVVEIIASRRTIAERLAARGREDSVTITKRIERTTTAIPASVRRIEIENDGPVAHATRQLLVVLLTEADRPPEPSRRPVATSLKALQDKIAGRELDGDGFEALIRDIAEGCYSPGEIARFLIATTHSLSDDEIFHLARVRAALAEQMRWDEPIVVDKHSIGGLPGSRITMIVVPIVAAHGLLMPKLSSRAITSAAGTADTMETLARVDLTAGEVRAVVKSARACIGWNGRLNHSIIDDVMNRITRPLGLDTGRYSVASILSKKLAAGSTHVIIDIPFGPRTKLQSREKADDVARLFRRIGSRLGLTVEVHVTAGIAPIGRGVGPSLEARDVYAVLSGAADAPADLRDKALFFAGCILAWDPAVGTQSRGHARARALLESGHAREAFERIIDAQGRRPQRIFPAMNMHTVRADRTGMIAEIDGWALASIVRAAGAPTDLAAGVDVLKRTGEAVTAEEPIFVIHASSTDHLALATMQAQKTPPYRLADS